MKTNMKIVFGVVSVLILQVMCRPAHGQIIPSPKDHFGFNIGDDYHLANYTDTEAYFRKLDAASDRMTLLDIGETEEGRRQYMFAVSSPENLQRLDFFKEISRKMARAEITLDEAKKLAEIGKPVVWIDGGLHSTETVALHQLIETAYQLASRDDAETLEILDKVIVLLVHANPDGHELVGDWYMRESVPERRSLSQLPRMYHKYVGHDNNRDFFMLNMKESKNISHQLFVEWIPQIVFNHHQPAPAGTVVVGPPYRDPFNYVYDPILITSLDALGAAIHTRLNIEDKPGYGQRGSSPYSTWWNGGLRTTVYFHNMIGILTEITGGPTPSFIPLVPDRLLPNSDSPNPVLPQKWHFRQSIDYSLSMNYAVLNYAARHRDELLFNIYRMGRNSIERGSRDNWSFTPNKINQIHAIYQDKQHIDESAPLPSCMEAKYLDAVNVAENRDPRAFLISADQPDWPTTVRFLNALIRSGVSVHRITESFSMNGKDYPKDSYAIKTAQAFRPHVLDMFEPQDHPNHFKYEGGPPIPPYDAAGWTPAFLMGIKFDRIFNDFSVPMERLEYGQLIGLPMVELRSAAVYQLSAKSNNSFLVVNELLKLGDDVYRDTVGGDFYIPLNSSNREKLRQTIRAAGIMPTGLDQLPSHLVRITPARVAIWDKYGGSIPSGWLRWIMEEYGFGFSVVYPPDIDVGNLNARYDVIVFVGAAIPESGDSIESNPIPETDIPVPYANRLGSMSIQKSVPELRKFLQDGGRIVTIGNSAHLARHLGVPVKDALTEWVDGKEHSLSMEKFFIPGSVLQARLAKGIPATWGMENYADVYFDASPVFKLTAEAISGGTVQPLMWFDSPKPLRSGWAWGQSRLQDGVAAFKASIGQGKLYVFGPEITFRAQAYGTFKLLFNQLYTPDVQ